MSWDGQLCTATTIRIRKIKNSSCAAWARDYSQPVEVTSTMPLTPPYDCTTPPTFPSSNNHPQTPRSAASGQKRRQDVAPRYVVRPRDVCRVNPRDGSPAVWQWPKPPKPPPRGFRHGDDLYCTFTMDAYMSTYSSRTPKALRPEYPTMHSSMKPSYYQPLDCREEQERSRQMNKVPKYTPRKDQRYLWERERDTMSSQNSHAVASTCTSSSGHNFRISAKERAAALMTTWRKTRGSSEVFNQNFCFSKVSLRRSKNRTPQISPRTSISSACGMQTTTTSTEECLERQRIDSRDLDMGIVFARDTPTPVASTRRQDLRSPASSSRTTSYDRSSGEAHPGQPADFMRFSFTEPEDDPHQPQSSPLSEARLGTGAEAYHEYLARTQRRKSFPANEPSTRRVHEESTMLAKLEVLDTEAKHFTPTDGSKGRKRPCAVDRKDRTKRTAPPAPVSIRMSSWSSAPGDPVLRRTSSDPSTEAFLKHVRASVAERKERDRKMMEYLVFADEVERGFLDERPL
jgi:hypothetical protein